MKRLFLFPLLFAGLAFSAALTSAPPGQNGFSVERLDRINTVMNEHVQAKRLAGASGLIARNGKIVFRREWGDMKPDSIVRMFSMTKGVTAVAAMMLYEEGKFSLTDPVARYLPEFANMRVAKEGTDASGRRAYYTVPADRPIMVRDLFRHTSGLDYAGPRDETGKPAYDKIGLPGYLPQTGMDLAEASRRLATAPLYDQPGTVFRYGYSNDILGRLIEVVSGKPLDQFFEERIFKPLGMKDSGFYVPQEKLNRLAVLYAPKEGGGVAPSSRPSQDFFKKKPSLFLGGAGLVSTMDDYARFYQMLLNEGEYDGVRLLGRKTVELMRTDHLGNMPHANVLPDWEGFGLTFAVNPGPGKAPEPGSAGAYRWAGAAGTAFWIDPKERLFGIFLIQIEPPNVQAADQFKRLTYQALTDQ
jgi:CubicO group peptidase (beta-lactamase class C family)